MASLSTTKVMCLLGAGALLINSYLLGFALGFPHEDSYRTQASEPTQAVSYRLEKRQGTEWLRDACQANKPPDSIGADAMHPHAQSERGVSSVQVTMTAQSAGRRANHETRL